MALAPNTAYSMLNKPKKPLAPNTAYNMLNPQTPGGVPPAQTNAAPPPPSGGGGGGVPGGSSIPYAGVYLQRQNEAQHAYEQAQATLLSRRNALYHQYGLTDSGQVDPYNRYGDYQMLLGREGQDLDAAREDAVGRGLGGSGLARQAESALRFRQGGEQLDFQNQVLGADTDYRQALAQALADKNSAVFQAQQDANDQAIQELLANGYWTQAGGDNPSGGSNNGNGSGGSSTPPPSTKAPTVSKAKDALARYLVNVNTPPKKKTTNKAV